MAESVRVRFAPSPTGPLHIGGVRTALYNYLFAKKHSGVFIVRIEDTDQTRYVPGAEDYIVESLKWAGISPDESPQKPGDYGPYRQSERKNLYRQYAEQLVENGHAYYAFDTPEELEAMRERLKKAGKSAPKYDMFVRDYMKNSLTLPEDEVKKRIDAGDPYVIRIKIPRKEEVRIHDEVRGWVSVQSNQMDDKVLFKGDGMPTYHMANIVDDHLMKITHVIRGEEWLPSAPLHQLLYRYLGWEDSMPNFAHLPLLLKPDGNGKLSKRDGDRLGFPVFPLDWTNPDSGEKISGYREAGYLPEAFINLLAMLGWNPGTEQEIFNLNELIEAFSLERVGKSGAKFDPDKAKWYNGQFIRRAANDRLLEQIKPLMEKEGLSTDAEQLDKKIELVKEKASFLQELPELMKVFYFQPEVYDEKVIRKKWDDKAAAFMQGLLEVFANSEDFSASGIELNYKTYCESQETGPGKYMQLYRVMISGVAAGPAIFELSALLGKEEIVDRLERALSTLSA